MEDVLEIYKRPYNPAIPVICMDEQPTQLIKETRREIAVEPGKAERVDYEYERNGTATNFMFTEPLGRWRKVNIRQRKTSIDWAYEVKELLDIREQFRSVLHRNIIKSGKLTGRLNHITEVLCFH